MAKKMNKELLDKIDEYVSEIDETTRSYGVAILQNGQTVNIRNNFLTLHQMFTVYKAFKKSRLEEKKQAFEKFLSETFGVFNNGEVIIDLDDIVVLINGEMPRQVDKRFDDLPVILSNAINYELPNEEDTDTDY